MHQFVKLKRQEAKRAKMEAMKKAAKGDDAPTDDIFEKVPPQYLDPCLGHVMRDPVRLPSSGAVVDRKVAVEYLTKFGKDLMDGTPLTNSNQLTSMDELRAEIDEWRAKRNENQANIDKVNTE